MQRILNTETTTHINKKVKVAGWVDSIRSHGKLLFIDLRDRTGLLQIVFTPKQEEIYKIALKIRPEWVIGVEGEVVKRPSGMVNPKVLSGSIELQPTSLEIFSESKTMPFPIDKEGYEISEEKRLKYRYLDLRRERMRRNIIFREKVIKHIREFLSKEDFIEIETPILTKSTPEGARDFLVPSRLQQGKFYALPQSPQQYKQLLMVAGFEKYFQIAKCFRDEDPRGDRQPEFTQLDIEMSFIETKDILDLIERLFIGIVKRLFPHKKITQSPFPRISYKTAMEKYQSDKPDLRRNKEDPNELSFAFIIDFPMFEWSKSHKRWEAMHHPFTRCKEKDIRKIKKDPGKILSYQYDLVMNGWEVGGGSLRSYKPEMLETVFEVMGHKKSDIRKKFGHLLEAFKYGVPPHGGIAPGIDRFLALLLNEPNIREVAAFPKTGDSRDPMMDVPSEVEEEQLKELGLKIVKKK